MNTTTPVTSPISDLFFMMDNSRYWAILPNNEYEANVAIHENAKEFCDIMEMVGFHLSVEDVVEDFLARV